MVCRSEVWPLCCCDEYTRQVLKSSGRSFLQSHKRSWKREHWSAFRASQMLHLGKRFVNVEQNLHAICWVSADKQSLVLVSCKFNPETWVGVCGIRRMDIGFLKTEPTSKFKNWKLGFRGSVFKKLTSAVWGRFFTLSHSQFIFLQHDRINSQSIFLHAVSLYFTSCSESLRLTISCTNSSRKYVISSVIHIKQHTVQKTEPKTETAVNLVKPNRKPLFFAKPNRSHFLLTAHP